MVLLCPKPLAIPWWWKGPTAPEMLSEGNLPPMVREWDQSPLSVFLIFSAHCLVPGGGAVVGRTQQSRVVKPQLSDERTEKGNSGKWQVPR